MKVVHSFETFGYVKLLTALHNVPENENRQWQCCGNIRSHLNKICFSSYCHYDHDSM
jgi:hypothetical protein